MSALGIKWDRYSKGEFFMLFAMLLLSADTVLFGTNESSFFVNLKYIFIAGLALVYGKKGMARIKPHSIGLLVVLIMTALLLLTGLMCNDLRGGYALRFLLIIAAFSYTSYISKEKFMYMFSDAIYIIGTYSIVCYVLDMLLPSVFSAFPVIVNISGLEFRNLFLCNIPIGFSVDRLWGPYSEPGIFQIMLNLALFFDIYLNKKFSYLRIGVFVAAVILTKSTTGYFILAMVLVYLVINKKGKDVDKSQYIVIVLLAAAAYLLTQYTNLLSADGMVFDKLQDTQRSSTAARLASVTCNIEMFLMSPIWGVGLTEADILFPKLATATMGVFTGSNTNQLLFQFASMGLFYGLIWTIGVAKFFNPMGTSSSSKFVIMVFWLLLCVGENLNWSILFYLFIFYGYQPSKKLVQSKSSRI